MLIGMRSFAVGLGAMMVLVMGSTAGQAAPCSAGLLSGAAALDSDWRDDRPGLCRQILPADLGPPSEEQHQPRPGRATPPQRQEAAAHGAAGVHACKRFASAWRSHG